MQPVLLSETIGGASVECRILLHGRDVVVSLAGGSRPHVGTTILAVPRPSLTGVGMSATSSVINVAGHKDELAAREMAEALASRLNAVVCVVCGIHFEAPSPALLAEIPALTRRMTQKAAEIIEAMRNKE